jgi:hypothetical protein
LTTKKLKRNDNKFWDFLQEKCVDCWLENVKRPTPRKGCGSFKVLACPKHAQQLRELHQLFKENPLPRLPRTKRGNG